MDTSSSNHNSSFNDPTWYFLAEYMLSELIVNDTLSEANIKRVLFQIIWELGIPPEHITHIESTWSGFVREAIAHLYQSGSCSHMYLRLFCQKKALDYVLPGENSSLFRLNQTSEAPQIIRQSSPEVKGGWGYFLVERGGTAEVNFPEKGCNWVDLYLYREGK